MTQMLYIKIVQHFKQTSWAILKGDWCF